MSTTAFDTLDWYDTPRYYDLVFDPDTEREAEFLEAVFERYGRARGARRRVLEPACGSGRLVCAMARRDWEVTGSDLNGNMIDYARTRVVEEGLDARLSRADMADFRPRGKFELAHCLVSTFKYLLSAKEARSHLECVARALAPGGIYVLGLHLSDYATSSRVRERWVVERAGTHVVCNIQTWPPDRAKRTERMRSRMTVKEDGHVRRCETLWEFRTYDSAQLRRLLRSVPDLEHVATYDFQYDIEDPTELSDELFDVVLVLRRGARSK